MSFSILNHINKIEFLARKNSETIELLLGYCQNFCGTKVESDLICDVLSKIYKTQKHLLFQIDKESMRLLEKELNIVD